MFDIASFQLPLAIGFMFLLVAGYFELKTYRVPNALTYGMLLVGLIAAGCKSVAAESAGGLGPALVGVVLGGVILLPAYAKGFLGAGCVKTQAAFGAWVGCAMGYADCVKVMAISTIVAAILSVAVFSWIIVRRKQEALEPGAVSLVTHGQLSLSIGTMLGTVIAFVI